MKYFFLILTFFAFVFSGEIKAEQVSDSDPTKKIISWRDRIQKKEAVVTTDKGEILDDLIEEELTIFKLNSGKLLTGKVQLPKEEGILTVKNGRFVSQEKYGVPQTGKVYQTDEVFPDLFIFYKTKSGQPFTGQIEMALGISGNPAIITVDKGMMVKRVYESQARGTKIFQTWKDARLISSEEYLEDVKISKTTSSGRINTEIHYDPKGRKMMEWDFPYNSSFADEYIERRFYAPDGRLVAVDSTTSKSWCFDDQFKMREISTGECLDFGALWREELKSLDSSKKNYPLRGNYEEKINNLEDPPKKSYSLRNRYRDVVIKTVTGKELNDLTVEEQTLLKLNSGELLTGRMRIPEELLAGRVEIPGDGILFVKKGVALFKVNISKKMIVPISDPEVPQNGKVYQYNELTEDKILFYKTKAGKPFTGKIKIAGRELIVKDGLEVK